jgi:ATP-binding cassette subfamily F protein 2
MRLQIINYILTRFSGLISQVANELWEVKNKKIRNLTKEDITIVDYKKLLVKDSQKAIEKAKLFSKGAKGKA